MNGLVWPYVHAFGDRIDGHVHLRLGDVEDLARPHQAAVQAREHLRRDAQVRRDVLDVVQPLEPVLEDLREQLVESRDLLERVGRARVGRVPELLDIEAGERVQLAALRRLVVGVHHRRIVSPAPDSDRARMPRQIAYIIGERGLRAFHVLRDAEHPHAVPRLSTLLRRHRRRPSATARPRTSSTPSSSASTSSRCSAAGSPTASSASTAPFSGSAWSTARATPASPLFETSRPASYTGLFLIALGSGGIKPLRLGVRRRPVRPVQQAPRQGRLRRLLLDHQLRLVLRVAA